MMLTSIMLKQDQEWINLMIARLEEMFNAADLRYLHKVAGQPLVTRETDQSTIWHKLFYESFDYKPNTYTRSFKEAYERFIRDDIIGVFGEPIVYQAVPTLRIQYPMNLGVGEFHKDSDYNHGDREINVWVPMTPIEEAHGFKIESWPNTEVYESVELDTGAYMLFDGVNLKHGNELNEAGTTRVSFDFRVIPEQLFEPSDRVSINTKKKFVVGDYFARMEP